jgi:hypothetical protein
MLVILRSCSLLSSAKQLDPESEVITIFQNVKKYLPSDKISHPIRLESSAALL